MAIDDGIASLWAVVVPTANTDVNLVTNPSFEVGTTGWSVSGSGTLTRVAGAGVFGGYGGRHLGSATGSGSVYTVSSIASGTPVVFSAWVKADTPLAAIRLNANSTTFDQAHPGDGAWHRLSVSVTLSSTQTPSIVVRDGRSSGWTNVDFDGVQVETGYAQATTYFDGDQDGCSWTGTVHASTSTRNGRDGRGGQIIDFATLGLYVTEIGGAGNAPMDVATQQLAYTDGSVYVRSLAKERVLTLTAEMLYPTGLIGALHTVRSAVVAALNLDKRDGRGPIVLRYGGASTPKRLTAYYEGGLEMEKVEPTTEVAALRFLCPDPYYYAETETQYALTSVQTVTSVALLAYRDANGTWSNMAGGSTASPVTGSPLDVVRMADGRLLVAGRFTDMGGVAAADGIAIWDGTAWSATVGTVSSPGYVSGLALAANGDVYLGGNFSNFGGVTNATCIAVYHPSSNTAGLVGSTGADTIVWSVAVDPATGYLWASGQFTTIGGTAAAGLAYYNGSAWVAATSGWAYTAGLPTRVVVGPDGRMYVTGTSGVFVWTGAAWSSIGATNATNTLRGIASVGGYLYAYGSFTTIGGIAANRIARWNGTAWSTLGSGAAAGEVFYVVRDRDGQVIAAGNNWGTIGGITPPDSLATWNGSTWLPASVNPPDTGTHANDYYLLWALPDGSMLLGWTAGSGTFGTTLTAEGITSVTNSGSANAYPVITLTSTGTLYSIKNLTTGQQILCSGLSIASGEVATLDLRPGKKTFTSPARDLRPYILPGSDLATFTLAPGTNSIAIYAAAGTATLRFKARSWSAD